MYLILASFSRARAQLLTAAGYTFAQVPSGVDEPDMPPGGNVQAYVVGLAVRKALAVSAQHPQAFILSADTNLYLDGRTIGKPTDTEDAVRMLNHMAGKTHELVTGICVVTPGAERTLTAVDTAYVHMRDCDEAHIRRYVEATHPLAYAGAYALQEEGCVLIEWMKGDPNTVIGLPMSQVDRLLDEAGWRETNG